MKPANDGLAPHVLHVLPNAASLELISYFGNKLRHTLVTADGAMPEGMRQSAYLKPASNFPGLEGLPLPGRMQKLAKAMTPYDLVLAHGWEALDVVMAHTLFKDAMGLPPLVHHEHEPDAKPSLRRKWYRRVALGKSSGLVVPGETLEAAALVDWQQPMGRVKRIPPAIDAKAFAKRPKKDGFRVIKHPGELWVGVWPERGRKEDLAGLLKAFSDLDGQWHLIVLGERSDSAAIDAEIDRLAINDRVHFPGAVKDPARVIGLLDIFAVPDEGSGFPLRAAQAMAAGLPVIGWKGGEVSQLLAPENAIWLVPQGDNALFAAHLHGLSQDKAERAGIGEANRARAVQLYDRDKVFATYRRLYSSAMKREF